MTAPPVPTSTRPVTREEELRNRRVLEHLPLVNHLVGRLAINLPASVDRMDLFHAGVLGLVRAAESFREDTGAGFGTYAWPCVKGAILDELRRMDYLSRQQREKVNDLFEARKELEAKLGRPPTVLEVSQKMGITTGQADETLAIARSVASLSLDRGSGDEGTKEMGDLLRNPRAPDPVEEASLHETKERLARAVAELPATERNVIVLYYDRGLLLREIAETLGVTESRVSQIHSRAILRLNEALREEGGEGTGGKAQRPERSRGGPAGAGPESARAGARA